MLANLTCNIVEVNENLILNIEANINLENITIKEIRIDTQNTFIGNNLSNESKSAVISVGQTSYKESLSLEELQELFNGKDTISFCNTIFYITVVCEYTTMGSRIVVGAQDAVFNKYPFYYKFMSNIKELSGSCNNLCDIPNNIIDTYLIYKGIQYSVELKEFSQTNMLWMKYFNKKNTINNCGCYGTA